MTTKRDIGLSIRTLRKKAGIKTQRELGRKLNPGPLSKETINRIETGRGNYRINALFRIAEALNCDVSDFFESKKKQSGTAIFEEILEEYKRKIIELEKSKDK